MSRLAELIEELCPDGVEYRPLGEIADLQRGSGMPKKLFIDEGIPAIHYGHIFTRYGIHTKRAAAYLAPEDADKLTRVYPGDLVVANTSENLEDVGKGVVWFGDVEGVTGGHATVVRSLAVDTVFLSYYLRTEDFALKKRKYAQGTKVIELSAANLSKIDIPLPPLEVQREIARILDQFTTLEAELEAELEARRAQYEHYRNHLLSYESLAARGPVNVIELQDVGVVRMCKRIHKAETSVQGDIPFFKISTFGGTPTSFISFELYEKYKEKYPYPKQGDLLISAAGTIGQIVRFDGADAYFQDSNIVWLEHDESIVLNRYLYYVYLNTRWTTDGGTIKRLYNNRILQQQICVPPIETQIAIADLLDRFDTLVNDISSGLPAEIAARRAQYEHYRDRLLSFPEKAASGDDAP